jgi:hypothetical protein
MSIRNDPDWLLLMFSLPAKQASKRVEIWRRLRRIGALALRRSGYLLPNTPENQERFQWLAAAVRRTKGGASVVQVRAIDDLPTDELQKMFTEARSRDYESLLRELKKLPGSSRPAPALLTRMRKRFREIAGIDFFNSPLRSRVESLLEQMENREEAAAVTRRRPRKEYRGRTWVTRPRPGIDRVSSAWLIRRFIDPEARFEFDAGGRGIPGAIPFDTFLPEGFGHRGEDCTFETLCREFAIQDPRAVALARMIHDADLGDEKYARPEAIGLDRVLIGWAQQGVPDEELLRRGMELIEGLYHSLPEATPR